MFLNLKNALEKRFGRSNGALSGTHSAPSSHPNSPSLQSHNSSPALHAERHDDAEEPGDDDGAVVTVARPTRDGGGNTNNSSSVSSNQSHNSSHGAGAEHDSSAVLGASMSAPDPMMSLSTSPASPPRQQQQQLQVPAQKSQNHHRSDSNGGGSGSASNAPPSPSQLGSSLPSLLLSPFKRFKSGFQSSTVEDSRASLGYLDEWEATLVCEEVNLARLRKLASRGVPDGSRATTWLLLLSCLPPKRKEWKSALERGRECYRAFKRELLEGKVSGLDKFTVRFNISKLKNSMDIKIFVFWGSEKYLNEGISGMGRWEHNYNKKKNI